MKQELELEAQRKQFELEQKFAEEAKNKEAELNAQQREALRKQQEVEREALRKQ